jgi:hypothetical protein
MEVKPEDIEDLPAGPNPITNVAGSDMMITLRAGAEVENSVAADILREYADGEEIRVHRSSMRELSKFALNQMSGYHMSLVMLCLGTKCLYHRQCPVARARLPMPTGRACPWEAALFKVRTSSLCNELGVLPTEPKQFIDYSMIRDLAIVELMLQRVGMEASVDPGTVKDQAVGRDPEGEVITREEVNVRYTWIDHLLERKNKLLQSLAATRRERIRLGAMTKADPTSYLMALLRKRQSDDAIPTMVTVSDPKKMVEIEVPPEEEKK